MKSSDLFINQFNLFNRCMFIRAICSFSLFIRGIVLYGTTEVGKPELRILIPQGATGTWHPYHVEFDSAGVIKMTDNMEMQTSCEDRSLTPEKHQPVNSLKYPALFPTVRNPDSHTSNQPFYGCLIPNPDSVYFSNSLNFKLSSFLSESISTLTSYIISSISYSISS